MRKIVYYCFLLIPLSLPISLIAQVKGNAYQQQVRGGVSAESLNQGYYDSNTLQGNTSTYSWESGLNWTNPNLLISRDDVMEFEVSSMMNVEAESFLAIFNITQPGETAAEADKLLNERLNALKEDLKVLGITNNDFYVDVVSLVPLYEFEVEKKLFSKNYNEVPSGFELQKNIHISYVQSELLDNILTAAARQEIYELVKSTIS